MTDYYEKSICWEIAETTSGRNPYILTGQLPTVASQTATFAYNGTLSGITDSGTIQGNAGNLIVIEKVGTQDWGGAIGDKEEFFVHHGLALSFKLSTSGGSPDKWKLSAADFTGSEIGVSSTEYDCASSANVTNITILRGQNQVRIWINGSLEIDAGASSTGWNNFGFDSLGNTSTHGGVSWYIGKILQESTTVPGRYLDPTGLTTGGLYPTSAGTLTGWPTVYPAATNDYNDTDDWNGGTSDDGDGATTGTTIQSGTTDGATYRHSMNTTSPAGISNHLGVSFYGRIRVTVASKSPQCYLVVHDGTTALDGAKTTMITTNYTKFTWHMDNNISGAEWGALTIASLQLGCGIDIAGGVNSGLCTVLHAEVVGCTFLSAPRSLVIPNTPIKHLLRR